MRLDKFLKVSRLIKRRTVANEACDAGRVLVNGKSAKASLNRTNQIIAASLQKVQAGLAPAEEPAETEPTTASSEEAA